MSSAVKVLLIIGLSLLVVGPCSGVGMTVLGMQEVYEMTAIAGSMADPSIMAAGISKALVSTILGLIVGGVGLVIALVGLIIYIATQPGPGHNQPPIVAP